MAGRVAPQPEVAGRGDQPLAEMPEPDAVDEDPRGQRVLADRAMAWASSSRPLPFWNGRRLWAGEHLEEPPRHGWTGPPWIAPDEDVRLDRLGERRSSPSPAAGDPGPSR